MPVDQSAYRKWGGVARPTRAAALAMASVLIGRFYKLKLVRWLVTVVGMMACVVAPIFLYVKHMSERDRAMAMAMRQIGFDQINVFALVNRDFHTGTSFFAVLICGVVAAQLIAEDRRAKALALYFSRPIRHLDYLLGKFLTGFFFVALLVLLPPILMYLAEIGISDAEGAAGDQLPVLLDSLLAGFVFGGTLVLVALAVSACTDRTNYAALIFLGLMGLSWVLGVMLARGVFRDPDWFALSPVASAHRIVYDLFPDTGQLRRLARHVVQMDVGLAWSSLAAWSGLSLLVLLAKVRRVEVVS